MGELHTRSTGKRLGMAVVALTAGAAMAVAGCSSSGNTSGSGRSDSALSASGGAASDQTASGGGSGAGQTDFPTKNITFTVQAAAGGGSDTTSRAIAKVLEKELGVSIVVQNRPGASGSIAVRYVGGLKPDGYNIGFCPIECSFFDLSGYDVKPDSIEYLGQIMTDVGTIAVPADSPYKNLKDLVTAAKVKKITVGDSGAGSSWEVAIGLLGKAANVTFAPVPFDGAAPAVTAAMGGKVDAVVAGEAETRSGVKAGKLRVLAIFSQGKSQFFPDIPTAKSQGYDIDFGSWGGIYAPKGLPAPVAQKLEAAIAKAVKDPAFVNPMRNAGITVIYKDSQDFTNYVMAQHTAFKSVLGSK